MTFAELVDSKVGTVDLEYELNGPRHKRPDMAVRLVHRERVRGGAVRSVCFYGATGAEAFEKLKLSGRKLPDDSCQ